ncbi:MAG: hypothetical protein ABI411_00605 [Tahibacter sp.]
MNTPLDIRQIQENLASLRKRLGGSRDRASRYRVANEVFKCANQLRSSQHLSAEDYLAVCAELDKATEPQE